MTKEEAMINVLVKENDELKSEISKLISTREPCEDCISRAELKKWLDKNLSFGGVVKKFELFDRLDRELPPVTPQPKIGRCINIDAIHSKCDRCGAVFEIVSKNGEANYCPNCGAIMLEVEE